MTYHRFRFIYPQFASPVWIVELDYAPTNSSCIQPLSVLSASCTSVDSSPTVHCSYTFAQGSLKTVTTRVYAKPGVLSNVQLYVLNSAGATYNMNFTFGGVIAPNISQPCTPLLPPHSLLSSIKLEFDF